MILLQTLPNRSITNGVNIFILLFRGGQTRPVESFLLCLYTVNLNKASKESTHFGLNDRCVIPQWDWMLSVVIQIVHWQITKSHTNTNKPTDYDIKN